jgi:hypothetical protein
MVARECRTGREIRLWREDLEKLPDIIGTVLAIGIVAAINVLRAPEKWP